MQGRLISVEGLDGTGKSTVVRALEDRLRRVGLSVLLLREPGGTPVGEEIRGLLADPSRELGARTELLLFSAARAELVATVVRPALARGEVVLLDRFVDSTLAYQGGGRELGDDVARAAIGLATEGLVPDVTLLLVADASVRAQRLAGRGGAPDRLEQAGAAMAQRTEARYAQLAVEEPGRVLAIEAGDDPAVVLERAVTALAGVLPELQDSGPT